MSEKPLTKLIDIGSFVLRVTNKVSPFGFLTPEAFEDYCRQVQENTTEADIIRGMSPKDAIKFLIGEEAEGEKK